MGTPRKKVDKTCKLRAAEKSYECASIKELAADLGIRAELIYRWRRDLASQGEQRFPGNGKQVLSPEEEAMNPPKKQLRERKLELEILKKAISIFSRRDEGSLSSQTLIDQNIPLRIGVSQSGYKAL